MKKNYSKTLLELRSILNISQAEMAKLLLVAYQSYYEDNHIFAKSITGYMKNLIKPRINKS